MRNRDVMCSFTEWLGDYPRPTSRAREVYGQAVDIALEAGYAQFCGDEVESINGRRSRHQDLIKRTQKAVIEFKHDTNTICI